MSRQESIFPSGQGFFRTLPTLTRLVFLALFLVLYLNGQVLAVPSPNAAGEVYTDQETGLMWQKDDSFHDLKMGVNWYDALEYVGEKNSQKLGGFDDWRLPTMQELNKLWDASRPLKSKDGERIGLTQSFEAGGSYYLWSSDERGLDNAWYFGLGHKENYFNLKDIADLDQGVKLVRKISP